MCYSTSWLEEGDTVRCFGWDKPRVLLRIIDRGAGWLAGLWQDGEFVVYDVIEDYEIVMVGKNGKRIGW